jgi:hypothetical protein
MEPLTILSIGKVLFELYNMVTEKTIEAEEDPTLDDGYKKHQHVHKEVCKIIDEKELKDGTKVFLKQCIDTNIRDQVHTLNKKGLFVKE